VVCPVGEVICPDTEDPSMLSCSYNRICGVLGMLPSSNVTLPGANKPAGALAPLPSTALLPPTLTLLGLQARVQITQGQPYLPCLEGQRQGCEPGATASSVVPGDMDPEIRLCADKALAAGLAQPLPYQQVGLLYCGLDTWQPGQYALTFTVARPGALYGQSGLQAAATRTLVVAALCEPGEVACGDGNCSAQDGTCPLANSMQDSGLPISYAATNTPPALTFRPGNGAKHNAELSSPVVRVKQGWQYVLCPPNVSPAPDQPCDPGVVASDEEDGPAIQRQVLLCPPAGCEGELGGCVGHRVFEKDVADCGIDTGTTAAVGSTFSLVFIVFDSGGLSASVQRLVQVVEPCAPGEVSCQASQDAAPTTRVLLLPSSATNVTLAAGNETMHVEPTPLSFLPCPSSQALGSAAVSCAAVALDSLEGDVSAALQEPLDVSPWDQARCSASSLTTGTCLPGTYIMAYTATNSNGTSTATALLTVVVEQRSVTRLNYSFVSPAASAPAAQLLVAQLLQNNSLVHSLVLSSQLPAFGLYPAYQPYATPPVQQRVRRVVVLGAEALQANDSSNAWIIALQLEVDMPSSQQAPPVQASSQQRRQLASSTLHHHLTVTQPLDGWISPSSPAPPAPTHAQASANSSAPGHGRGRSAHLLAAVRGSQEAVRGLQGQLSQLGQLLKQHLSQGALLPELPPRPSQAAPSTGLLEVLMQQGGQGGQGGPLLQSLAQKGGQGGQGGRRSLQQSGSGWVQACGMKLVIPAVVAGASGVPGSLVAASVAEPTCTTPAAPPQVVLLGLLAGLVGSLQAGAAAVRASQSTLLQALPVAGGALDATDQQVATELQLWRGAGVDAASSQAVRAQVLSDLQSLTQAAQAAQALALASVSSLLAATLDAAITYAPPMQLTTSLLMASLAAQPGGNTSTRDARFSACLLARAATDGEKYSFLLRRFAEALDPGGQEGGSAAGSRLDPLQHLPGLVASEPRLPRYAGTGGHNKVLAGLLLHVVRKPLSALSDTSRSTCSGSALGSKLDPACSGRRTYSSLSDLGGFGTDPVFNSRSGLFNAHLDVSDWYNASAGSGELSSTQAPFAFFHHPLPGLEAGYPVLVDTGISAKRAAQVLSYVLDGNYVEKSLTHSVSVQLLSYNPAAAVFGCWRLRLDWQQDGRIVGTHQVQALPVPDYGAGTGQWVLARLAPDLALLLLVVTYCALTAVDVGFTLARQHKIVQGVLEIEAEEAAKLRHAPVAMGSVRQQTLSRTVQWSYASRLTPGWLAYEVTQCALQVAAVAVYFLYVTQVMDGSSFQSSFPAYDSQAAAPARYLLPARATGTLHLSSPSTAAGSTIQGSTIQGSTPAIDVAALGGKGGNGVQPLAGTAGRWALPANLTGLQQAATMFQSAQQTADLYVTGFALAALPLPVVGWVGLLPAWLLAYTPAASPLGELAGWAVVLQVWYGLLQGAALIFLLVFAIKYISFQPRLALVFKTLAAIGLELLHFLMVYAAVTLPLVVCLVMVWGSRVSQLSSLGAALLNTLQANLLHDAIGMITFQAVMDPGVGGMTGAEAALAQALRLLVPLVMMLAMTTFLVAMLLRPYSLLRLLGKADPGVHQDFVAMWRWAVQGRGSNQAPNNSHLDAVLDACLEGGMKPSLMQRLVPPTLKPSLAPKRALSHCGCNSSQQWPLPPALALPGPAAVTRRSSLSGRLPYSRAGTTQLEEGCLLELDRITLGLLRESLSTHLPGCGAGVALAALAGWVGSAACSALVRLAGWGVLGPGSEAAGSVAAWLLRGGCGGLRGATTGHHIMPRTGCSRC
ncbi:hypothetical protein QJQ45_019807, partial [Haematococcus lacustris]